MKSELKPNGVRNTAYPDAPAEDYNAWTAHITGKEIVRDMEEYKRKFDALWAEFKTSIENNYG